MSEQLGDIFNTPKVEELEWEWESVEDPQARLIEKFLPLILWVGVITSVILVVYIVLHEETGQIPVPLLIALPSFVVLLVVRWFTDNQALIANGFLAATIAAVSQNLMFGAGSDLKSIFYITIVPPVAFLLVREKRNIAWWLTGYGILLIGITGGVSLRLFSSPYTVNELAQASLTAVVMSVIMGGALFIILRFKQSIQDLLGAQQKTIGALKLQMAESEAITQSLGQALVVSDAEGLIRYVNRAFEKTMGWDQDEVVGKPIVEVMPREDEEGNRVHFENRIFTQVLEGKPVTTDVSAPFFYIPRHGDRFPVSSTISPIVLDDSIIGAVETFRDISREKEIDTQKTEFVSLASHQLRTPLSTISWYAEMLLAGDVGKLTEEQEQYLKEIYHGNQRMVELVAALLDVSRIELGTFTVDPEPTDIVKLVRSVLDELKPQSDERHITVKEEHDDLPEMSLDPKLLRMVFQNLLSNAIKYTPEGGDVDITLRKDESDVVISVSDTGMGIPKEQQDRIFSKLFRADNVQEVDAEGTGLGLYIVKSIISHSGGTIWFESEEDAGTTFYVRLPLSGMEQREGSKKLGS